MSFRRTKARSLVTRLLLLAIMIQGALIGAATPAAAAAPQTTIVSGPSSLIPSRSAAFGFKSSLRRSTFQCKLDAGKWSKCTSPKGYTSLAQGAHTFRVRALKNGAVDRTPAVRTFTVDTVKPQTTITDEPLARIIHDGSPSFQFTSSEPGTFECRLDNAAFAACASPFVAEMLPDRIYTFQARARDVAGNRDATPATYQFSKVSMMSNSLETGEAAAAYLFPDELTMDVPPNCGGSPSVDCPGGNPNPPADQLSITSTARTVVKVVGANRFDVAVTIDVETLQPIDINVPLVGDCQMTLDSGQGTTPTWRFDFPLNYVFHSGNAELHLAIGDATLNFMEDDDVELVGGFGCQFANLGVSFFIDTLRSWLTDFIRDLGPVCMAPGPALFERCPWAAA